MSYRSTVVFIELPGGGEVHVYDTCDPEVTDTEQRRINVRLPSSANPIGLPDGMDYDEPLPVGLQSAEGDRVLGRVK